LQRNSKSMALIREGDSNIRVWVVMTLSGLEGIHIECKRVERLNVYDAMEQAIKDAKADELPAVFWRKNKKEWLVTMTLSDWIELYKGWLWSEKNV